MKPRGKVQSVIKGKEVFFLACFYLFFAALYYTTLWINRGGFSVSSDPYWNLKGMLNWGGIDYLFKFLLSIPVAWLMFVTLRSVSLSKRLLIHLFILPVFVLTWQQLYYLVIESLGMFHLAGLGQAWDIYIPALFYILQFSALHAYVYFKENEQRLKVEAQLKETTLKSELAALKAQLNPHFLYNVFNTINASVPPELEQTRNMIAELSDLFRYQLQASKSDLVTLREELDFTTKYLQLEKARFEDRLQVSVTVEEYLLDELLPPMLIQPLVENAVKHGIAPLIEGGKISIIVNKTAGKLSISVADTGRGVKDKTGMIGCGTGLTNTALRLDKMFGTAMQFTDSVPHGLTVNFALG